MHILQVLPSLNVGGVERGVLDLAKGLIQRGHRVSVVSSGGSLVEPLLQLGAGHYTMPVHRKSPWTMWQLTSAMARLIRDAKIDVVHARSRVPAWVAFAAARRAGVPFVTTCHGFYQPHPASGVMTWGRQVIVPSHVLGRYVIDRFHVAPSRLRVIPRGVDLAAFPFRGSWTSPDGVWKIGIVGRLSWIKGHDVAIRALHQLVRQGLPVRLCIIGHASPQLSEREQRLRRLADDLEVTEFLEWSGTRPDMGQALRSLDLVIMPSVYPESFGRSAAEAQAVGVPVIASRIGALPEIIEDEQTGLLVPPNDASALAQAIRRVMHEPGMAAQMVTQARRKLEETLTVDQMVEATLAVYAECRQRPRLLVWKLSALGDVILATPSLRAIRRRHPDAWISLVVRRPSYDIVARCPYVDDVQIFEPGKGARRALGCWRMARMLRREGYECSIDFQNSRATHALAWLAGIPVRVGYARKWGRLLTKRVPMPLAPMSPVAHQQHLLRAAGWPSDGDTIELWPSDEDRARMEQWLEAAQVDAAKPMIGLHIGGSERWKTKRWELSHWAALCDWCAKQGYEVVLTGAPSDRALGEQLRQSASHAKPVLALGALRLMELACLIRRCRAFVTTDSAPLHIAAAVGTPTIALFGPTDPARHAPEAPTIRVLKKPVFCSPCYSTWCRTRTHACMKRIAVEDVIASVLSFTS